MQQVSSAQKSVHGAAHHPSGLQQLRGAAARASFLTPTGVYSCHPVTSVGQQLAANLTNNTEVAQIN